MHPWGNFCDDKCAYLVVGLSFGVAFVNLNIYEFVVGDSFGVPVTYYSYIKSLKEDNSNKNNRLRKLGGTILFILDMWLFYFIIKNSWIFV
jgi:hypothetical protein